MRKLSIIILILILVVSTGCRKEMTMAEKKEKAHEVHRLQGLYLDGRELTPEEVNELENIIIKDSEDIENRAKIVGYYFYNKIGTEEYPKYIPHVMNGSLKMPRDIFLRVLTLWLSNQRYRKNMKK